MQIYFGRHKKKGEGETSVHSCTRMSENFRFGYPIYESCHMAKNKGGFTVTDCMNMKLKLGEYILQLHTSQIDTIEPEGKWKRRKKKFLTIKYDDEFRDQPTIRRI